jgi:hypothetical protein
MGLNDNPSNIEPLPAEYTEELNELFSRFRHEVAQIGARYGYHRMILGVNYTENKEDIETGRDLPYYTGIAVATEALEFFNAEDIEGMFKEFSEAWIDMADAVNSGEMLEFHRKKVAETPGGTVH